MTVHVRSFALALFGSILLVGSFIALYQMPDAFLSIVCIAGMVAGASMIGSVCAKKAQDCRDRQEQLEAQWHDQLNSVDTGLQPGLPLFMPPAN